MPTGICMETNRPEASQAASQMESIYLIAGARAICSRASDLAGANCAENLSAIQMQIGLLRQLV